MGVNRKQNGVRVEINKRRGGGEGGRPGKGRRARGMCEDGGGRVGYVSEFGKMVAGKENEHRSRCT